ncbi:hypothetical protein GGI43DRAFT_428842 [Trichoderma evansii]
MIEPPPTPESFEEPTDSETLEEPTDLEYLEEPTDSEYLEELIDLEHFKDPTGPKWSLFDISEPPMVICGAERREEPEVKESPLAALIREDLAAGPPMKCMAWKNALQALDVIPSSQRTTRALITLLRPAIRDEEEYCAKLTTMSESLHIESIQNLDFNEVWDVIRHLAGQPKWTDGVDFLCGEWLDLRDIVRALSKIRDRIEGKCWGVTLLRNYDIPRGIQRYESLWKSVMEILGEGRMGARMQAYVDALLESSSLDSSFN